MKTLDIMAIPLTQGFYALVDGEDFEELSKHKWRVQKTGNTFYARRAVGIKDKQVAIYMHRFILNPPKRMETDHRNGNGLDNRRHNLRICTHAENLCNQIKPQTRMTTSKYKGVHWDSNKQRWIAQIGGKRQYLGCFSSELEAAKAYNAKAKELFGKFANPNFQGV